MYQPILSGLQDISVMESAISNLNLVMSPYCPTHVSYGRNLVRASRDFLLAVFGVRVSSQASSATNQVDRAREVDGARLDQVERLAARYDSISPNLASELRMIARSAS